MRLAAVLAMTTVVLLMAGLVGGARLVPKSTFEQWDATVWYCAGRAVNAGADPYRVEPLRSCEIANEPNHARRFPYVEPAPLPGYALAAFALWARLPFALARTAWLYVLIASVVGTALLLAKLTRLPPLLTLLCLGMADGYFNLYYAELPPLPVAALVAAAALGGAQRYRAAALAGAVALIEPHIGLPACLAMFVWWPRTRVPLGIIGAVFAAVSVAAIGLPANIEYVRVLLPAQAAAEIAAADQYSLTRVLHILGLADRAALLAGTLSYAAMTLVGVLIARRTARALDAPGLVVLLPPALVLFGGLFVHDLQMAAAIPAAILVAASPRLPLALRAVVLVALVFPWQGADLIRRQTGLLEVGSVVGAMLIATWSLPIRARLTSVGVGAIGVLAVASAIAFVPRVPVGPRTPIAPLASAPTDLSASDWAAKVSRDRSYSTPDAHDVAEKVPLWTGLGALALCALTLARRGARAPIAEPTSPAVRPTARWRVDAPRLARPKTTPIVGPGRRDRIEA